MDRDSLPPLPSVEELFAPTDSQQSSFLNNVNLFLPALPLPSATTVPPLSLTLPSAEYSEPYSPVPPQPTSPLVDQFDYPFGSNNITSDSAFQPQQEKSSELPALSGPPPSKKARYDETAEDASDAAASPLYDSREEGEISDEDDVDQPVTLDKSASSRHKPPSPRLTVSRNEQPPSQRRLPASSPQNVNRTSPLSSHHHHSRTSDTAGRSSHHHHRHHHAHSPHSSSKAASKSSGHHHRKADGANVYKMQNSSRHKQPDARFDGCKELDYGKDISRYSDHRSFLTDRADGIESAKHKSRIDRHKGSDHTKDTVRSSADRRLSGNKPVVTETSKHESSSVHRHRRSVQSDLLPSKDCSRLSDRQRSPADESETAARKDDSESLGGNWSSSLADRVHRRSLSSSASRSSRLHHVLPGSTLGSEIMKNMSRSAVNQQPSASSSLTKSDLQLLNSQHQLADGPAAGQLRSLDSGKVPYLGIDNKESRCLNNHHASSGQSDAVKQTDTSQTSCHQLNLLRESAVTEKPSSHPQRYEGSGNAAASCGTTLLQFAASEHLLQLHVDVSQGLQPTGSAVVAATQHSAVNLPSQEDLDAPYSPGSLNLHELLEPDVASDLQEAILNDNRTSSDVETVPQSALDSSTESKREIINVKEVEDSVVEIDASDDLLDEFPAGEEAEVAAETAAVVGRGQEYEIIDDLDSNDDEADGVGSSDNSEAEFDSVQDGQDGGLPLPEKRVETQRVKQTDKAPERTQNSFKQLGQDRDEDDDFEAPVVNHKVILYGE